MAAPGAALVAAVMVIGLGCVEDKPGPGLDAGADAAVAASADFAWPVEGPVVDAGAACAPAAWTAMKSPTAASLQGVWGSGASEIYAVGFQGTVLRYDGAAWAAFPQDQFNGYLTAVWGEGASGDLFAVGSESTILRYRRAQKSWTRTVIADTGALNGIWRSGDSNVYAVGWWGIDTNTQAPWVIHHYDGSSWSSKTLPGPGEYVWAREMYAVWGSGPADVHVAGSSHLLHHDGSTWTDTYLKDQIFHGVWGCAGEAFAVGRGGLVYRRKGSIWSKMTQSVTTTDLHAVWCSAPDDVYAVGRDGVTLRYDGKGWSALCSGTREQLHGVWGTGTGTVYAVGDRGTILRYTKP